MTNTDTADLQATATQVAELARAGSEVVARHRQHREAAAQVPRIASGSTPWAANVPLVGDFHFNGTSFSPSTPIARARCKVPDQSGQCRAGRQARRAIRDPDRDGLPLRQSP